MSSKPKPLSFRSPNEILAMEFDDSDLILGDRYLAETQVMSLCGAGGVGKSRIVSQIAVSQRLGIPFGLLPTYGRPRKWMFLQTENSVRRQKFELTCLRNWVERHHPGKWELVNEGLLYHTLETDTDGLLHIEIAAPLILAGIMEHKPDVPVFDPIKDFTTGDLNADRDMLAVAYELTRLAKCGNPKRAPLFVHHALTGKLGATKAVGYDRSSFGRNSKVLMATVRAQINVVPYDENNNDRLVIASGKNNNGREFEPFAVELNTLPGTDGYMIYEVWPHFDLETWQEGLTAAKKKKGPRCTPEMLVELAFNGDGEGLKKAALAKLAMDETGVGRAYSFDLVREAVDRGLLIYSKSDKLCYLKEVSK